MVVLFYSQLYWQMVHKKLLSFSRAQGCWRHSTFVHKKNGFHLSCRVLFAYPLVWLNEQDVA